MTTFWQATASNEVFVGMHVGSYIICMSLISAVEGGVGSLLNNEKFLYEGYNFENKEDMWPAAFTNGIFFEVIIW